MARTNRFLSYCPVFVAILVAIAYCPAAVGAELVINGDFEEGTDLFVTWPGYVGGGSNPAEIPGWTGTGGRGINPVVPGGAGDAPFRDNGDNQTSVALIQGTASLEQEVTGFAVGQDYVLSLDFNSRDCCGDFPIATISLDGEVVGSSTDLFPDPGLVPPVNSGGEFTEPWYHADIDFTASETSITLTIASAPAAGGDATLIIDNVSIVPEPSSGLLALLGIGLFVLLLRRQ